MEGHTNHALEFGAAWVTRVETHAQPMSAKAISHTAATMSEELQLKRSLRGGSRGGGAPGARAPPPPPLSFI